MTKQWSGCINGWILKQLMTANSANRLGKYH